MKTTSIEELALKAMSQVEEPNVSWNDFTSQLEANEEEFNKEIKEMERLDTEAQNEALSFYVR
jgi:hypothetical protein